MRKLAPWLLLAAFLWFYFSHYGHGIPGSSTAATPTPPPAVTVTTSTEETTSAATPDAAAPAPKLATEAAPAMEAAAAPEPSSPSPTPYEGEDNDDTRPGPKIGAVEGAIAPVTSVIIPIIVKADRDGDVNHCEGGRLQLKGPELRYDCPPPHESKSVHLMVSEVKAVDKNGIQLHTNKKYHFHVKDMSDAEVALMFRNWLGQSGTGIPHSGR